jgi:hypothetical protein
MIAGVMSVVPELMGVPAAKKMPRVCDARTVMQCQTGEINRDSCASRCALPLETERPADPFRAARAPELLYSEPNAAGWNGINHPFRR